MAEVTNFAVHLAIDARAPSRDPQPCGCGRALAIGTAAAVVAIVAGWAPWQGGRGRGGSGEEEGGPRGGGDDDDDLECPLTTLARRAPTTEGPALGVVYAAVSGVAAAVAQRALAAAAPHGGGASLLAQLLASPPPLAQMLATGCFMLVAALVNVCGHAAAWTATGRPISHLTEGCFRFDAIGVAAAAAGVLHVVAVAAVGALCAVCVA